MLSTLDSFTKFVNSPGGVVTAGAVLAGIVWKVLEKVEGILPDQTKLEIAVWLVGRKFSPALQSWPDMVAKAFNHVFGRNLLSWKSFLRSLIASAIFCLVCTLVSSSFLLGLTSHTLNSNDLPKSAGDWLYRIALPVSAYTVIVSLFAFLSLLETRIILLVMRRCRSAFATVGLLILDLVVTGLTASPPAILAAVGPTTRPIYDLRESRNYQKSLRYWKEKQAAHPDKESSEAVETYTFLAQYSYYRLNVAWRIVWLPAFSTSLWLWLYAGSALLLKAVRRFDLGFDWFNRKFDIEKKPLQSIGFVAGAIVAIVYWAAVGIGRLF